MAQNLPENTANIEHRMRVDVQREAPDSDPFVSSSFLGSIIKAFARRIFDFYEDMRLEALRRMPHTADAENAEVWGGIYVGNRNTETQARGNIVVTGAVGSTVPAGTIFSAGENEYRLQADIDVKTTSLSILSIELIGTKATVITSQNHNLSSFVPVNIFGAGEPEYNVTAADITVIDDDAFTFEVTGTPASPATGAMGVNFVSGVGEVVSIQYGSNTNLDFDASVSLQTPIVGIDDDARVDFGAIGSGSDIEELEDYKARYLERIRNPVSHYNVSAIVAQAKQVNGVSRVFVQQSGDVTGTVVIDTLEVVSPSIVKGTCLVEHGLDDGQNITITGADQNEYNVTNCRVLTQDLFVFYFTIIGNPASPATGAPVGEGIVPLGQSITYFMRDGDANPIPTASEVAAVKAEIDEIRPVNTVDYNNIVGAPTPVAISYTVVNLIPDTISMRDAIEANLRQFHDEEVQIGGQLDQDKYRAAIANSVDLTNGDTVKTFELTSPVGDVAIGTGDIAQFGGVSF